MEQGIILSTYLGAFVDELARCGLCHVVISPGSRSTPLALLLAEHPAIQVWLHIDERSAGFFALGMAKASRKTVALLCSSGTAAANYMPAVVEAHQSRVPLLLLTADRPPELRDVGAPQAIDQIHIFGRYVKWFVEMALPEVSPDLLQYARMVASRALMAARSGLQGPVHLNFPFRESLIPDLSLLDLWKGGREEGRCYTRVLTGYRQLEQCYMDELAQELRQVERGLIVCGPQDDPLLAGNVVALAERLQYPVLADPLSQIRSGGHDKRWIIESYDAFLRDREVIDMLKPQVVIRFGAAAVSKALFLYLKQHSSCRQIVVDDESGWQDPTLAASDMLYVNPIFFLRSIGQAIGRKAAGTGLSQWSRTWMKVNEAAKEVILRQVSHPDFWEVHVYVDLLACLPDQSTLFIGNSMPVRDLDTFFFGQEREIRVIANRGANGIDGVVSSALGAATAAKPLVLVLGDLSFYHDLNGLLAAKLHKIDITIVVINNDGGGIFSFLPQAKLPRHFEELFGTPLGLDFQAAVRMYGGEFYSASSRQDFRQALRQSLGRQGLKVLEVIANRSENVSCHRTMWNTVSEVSRQTLANIGR
ncbi:MAG: 2-succinyl-5-enolpyruvyl-6-hydroxy-3-cyclohexene-carboxylic-acid synthase [Firmicutes bacterium]|nr:2-succinyl-5-enolpyruvyl-6-hydroxy-3-cyclohexene-carboxylic-acid synthase [Bacillota bacterium]